MKLIKRILILLLTTIPFFGNAQIVDYNTIILPQNVTDISFAEKLVRLAWQNNPTTQILNYETEMADIEIKQARWSWLDGFRVQGNVNEFTLNNNADEFNRAAFFPKYNIAGQVSLSYFVGIPLEVKKQKQAKHIVRSNIDLQKLTLRAVVLTRYETYLMNRELLKIQTEIVEDLYSSYSVAEQRFKNGEITLEIYNEVLDRYNGQKVRQITAQGNFNISKISLEELIGVRLEDVL